MAPENAYLARQAIFDTENSVCGYELLYRSARADADGAVGEPELPDSPRSAAVLTAALTDIGLSAIVGDQPAWVNLGGAFLADGLAAVLPPERTVVEILKVGRVDDSLLDAFARLRAEGYRVALGGALLHDAPGELLELADVVKLDSRSEDRAALERLIARLLSHDLALLAENVDTYEALEVCRTLGFSLFQGEFLSQPRLFSSARVSTESAVRMQLAAQLNDPEASFDQLAAMISADVTLSYRLLRYINSAHVGLRRPVNSMREAIVFLGSRRVRSWAMLLLLADSGGGRQELVVTALVRARMCESLAGAVAQPSDEAFTTGLLSVADALIDRPLSEVIGELPLDEQLSAALLERQGPLGDLLCRVVAFEQGDFDVAAAPPFDARTTTSAYIEAIDWSSGLLGALS